MAAPEFPDGLPVWGQIVAAAITLFMVTWGALAKFLSEKNKKGGNGSNELVVTNAALMDTKAFKDMSDQQRVATGILRDILDELKIFNQRYNDDLINRNMHDRVESMVRNLVNRRPAE